RCARDRADEARAPSSQEARQHSAVSRSPTELAGHPRTSAHWFHLSAVFFLCPVFLARTLPTSCGRSDAAGGSAREGGSRRSAPSGVSGCLRCSRFTRPPLFAPTYLARRGGDLNGGGVFELRLGRFDEAVLEFGGESVRQVLRAVKARLVLAGLLGGVQSMVDELQQLASLVRVRVRNPGADGD